MSCRLPCVALFCTLIFVTAGSMGQAVEESQVDYSRDVRPILSDRCFACHGPDEASREGGFRLDVRESALGEAESGEHPIVPGDIDASEILRRMMADDADEKMPPEDSQKKVSPAEIEIIRQWIAEGAPWHEHWAFIAPQRPAVPDTTAAEHVRNPIDAFVLSRLAAKGMAPSPMASKETLIRRVTFDLTGLPPTLAEVDAFLADTSEAAYEKLVDRLLASPAYGEHLARYWLDAVRYGDTHGLHLDNYREIWPYRDWVVQALNQNLSYDQFVTQQLAGDLLPNPTTDQIIATGFNRCNVTTSEGGSIVEEVYVRNVVDRVVTTGTVLMGITFDCTRCHDHKYDPLTQKDFYSFFAYFNSIDGGAMDGNKQDHPPVERIVLPEAKAEIAKLRGDLESVRGEIRTQLAKIQYQEPAQPAQTPIPAEPVEFVWIEDAVPPGANAQGGWSFVANPQPVYSGEKSSTRTAKGLSQHFFDSAPQPLSVGEGDVLFTYVYLDAKNPPKEIMLQWNSGQWAHRAYWGGNEIPWGEEGKPSRMRLGDLPKLGEWVRLEVPAAVVGLTPGIKISGWAFTQFDGTVHWDKAGIVSRSQQQPAYESQQAWETDQLALPNAPLPDEIKTLLKIEAAVRDAGQQQTVRDYFLEHIYTGSRQTFNPLHDQLRQLEQQITDIEQKKSATTLIFRETKAPKPAFILKRGEYDQKGDQVERATPAVLPPFPADAPQNRLGLAQWLLSPEHPLTARVFVNRLWQQVFGTGIVKTSEDFGSQGAPPSHPELLDWLAVDFRENGWDIQRMLKQIVMSATYQQASRVTPDQLARDPENRLLSRGPRFRLDAEAIRDEALAVSGLLSLKMGGPSVKPPQPDGLWFAVGYSGSNTVRFVADKEHDQVHRRTLYTFIKRTSPPPQMMIVDGPSREASCVRRERTNTPLQALMFMNDPQFFEAARAFAERALGEGGTTSPERATFMFRLATARLPNETELAEMVRLVEDRRAYFAQNEAEAAKVIAVGSLPPDAALAPAELAAWTILGNLILNLDETLTKS